MLHFIVSEESLLNVVDVQQHYIYALFYREIFVSRFSFGCDVRIVEIKLPADRARPLFVFKY
jgi:hypothetical protein